MTEPPMAIDGSDLQQVALERPHVLMVDDTSVMRKAIQRILAQDFIVIEAKDGGGAWEIITS
jgi:CheY-like chemotaxis protein